MHQRAPKTRVHPGPLGPWTPADRTSRSWCAPRANILFFTSKYAFYYKIQFWGGKYSFWDHRIQFLIPRGWQVCIGALILIGYVSVVVWVVYMYHYHGALLKKYSRIMKWFTVHHVVDLKRSVCLFILPWLALRRTGLVLKRTKRTKPLLMTDSQPVRNVESKFFLELLKKE